MISLRPLRIDAWCFFLPMTRLEEEALHERLEDLKIGRKCADLLMCWCANDFFAFLVLL